MDIKFSIKKCSLGWLLAAKSNHGICTVSLGEDQKELTDALLKLFPEARLVSKDTILDEAFTKITAFIENPKIGIDLPLDIQGTPFQQRVWKEMSKVPAGRAISYTELAKRIHSPKSVRAVANACGANKLAIVIPCHRIIGSNGNLTGYRWGLEVKRSLLQKEGAL